MLRVSRPRRPYRCGERQRRPAVVGNVVPAAVVGNVVPAVVGNENADWQGISGSQDVIIGLILGSFFCYVSLVTLNVQGLF